jgi:hypothetical protein
MALCARNILNSEQSRALLCPLKNSKDDLVLPNQIKQNFESKQTAAVINIHSPKRVVEGKKSRRKVKKLGSCLSNSYSLQVKWRLTRYSSSLCAMEEDGFVMVRPSRTNRRPGQVSKKSQLLLLSLQAWIWFI